MNREYFKIFKASDGSFIVLATGSVTASYTNLETGKTVTENISGPTKTTVFPDGFSPRWRGDATSSTSRRPTRRASGCLP